MKNKLSLALATAFATSFALSSAVTLAEDSDIGGQSKSQAIGYVGKISKDVILSGYFDRLKSTDKYDHHYNDGEDIAARVKFWHDVALDTCALDHTPGANPNFEEGEEGAPLNQGGPTRTSRALAMVQTAVFDALNTIENEYTSYSTIKRNKYAFDYASADAAITFAAARMLRRLYPAQRDRINEIFRVEKQRIRQHTSRDEFRAGREIGIAAFKAVRDARRGDKSRRAEPDFGEGGRVANGARTTFFGTRVNGGTQNIGEWEPDPNTPPEAGEFNLALGAFWGNVRPFFLNSGDQFRTPEPPLPDTPEYTEAYNFVAGKGGAPDNAFTASTGNEDTRFIGNYWGYDGVPLIGVPPRVYNQIALQLAKTEYSNDGYELARILAMVNVALADVAIAAWDSKYFYNYWRPVTGIRRDDNNANTAMDLTWNPVGVSVINTSAPIRPTPPFPAYPSGHSAFGASMFEIMRDLIGDDTPFTFVSDEYNGEGSDPLTGGISRPFVPVRFATLTEAQLDNGNSRIFNGVHWEFDNIAGQNQGVEVARFLLDEVTAFKAKIN